MALGGNWTQSNYTPGGNCIINGSSDLTSDSGEMCFWNANIPNITAYTCGKISGSVGAQIGVCIAVDGNNGGNGACCLALGGAPDPWAFQQVVNGTVSIGQTDSTPSFNVGDYIGIERITSTMFQCFRSTDGHTWTALGPDVIFGGMAPNPGRWGAFAANGAPAYMLEVWEAGNGALPTTRNCGTP